MASIDRTVVEMPEDPSHSALPPYAQLVGWTQREVAGLSAAQIDFDDLSPDKEWMWWSIRRQVSHMAWDSLVFTSRRCGHLLWPTGPVPEPIVWRDHRLGPNAKWDRVLDENLFWELPDLIDKLAVGVSWLQRVSMEQSLESLRSDQTSVHATHFWKYATSTLPRGVDTDPEQPEKLRYTLEASLWMVFYEILTHIRTIQRLKLVQGIELAQELPRVGYLRLPEYWGDTDVNGPSMERIQLD